MTPTGSAPCLLTLPPKNEQVFSEEKKEKTMTPSSDQPPQQQPSASEPSDASIPRTCTRCTFCKKKQILLSSCRCNGMFCIQHCNPESHSCSALEEYGAIERRILKERLTSYQSKENHTLVERI